MSFQIRTDTIDVVAVMAAIRKRIQEKRKGVPADAEIEASAENHLDAVLDAHEFNLDFAVDARAEPPRWNYAFGADTVYESSRGAMGWIVRMVRGVLRPVQKLVWNPQPMISALARQSALNVYYAQVLRSLWRDVTRVKHESEQLERRVRDLDERLAAEDRRETTST